MTHWIGVDVPKTNPDSRDSIDGICVMPECDREATQHLSEPLCERHILRVYRSALMLVTESVPTVAPDASRTGRRGINSATPGVVYFIGFGPLVKIGFSTNLPQRLKSLPHERVLGTLPGTMRDEKALHRKFSHLRQQGEWFRGDPELMEFIATLDAA